MMILGDDEDDVAYFDVAQIPKITRILALNSELKTLFQEVLQKLSSKTF